MDTSGPIGTYLPHIITGPCVTFLFCRILANHRQGMRTLTPDCNIEQTLLNIMLNITFSVRMVRIVKEDISPYTKYSQYVL